MANRTRTVFLKELRETFRDRRVLLGVFVWPLLITPVLMLSVGGMFAQKNRSNQAEVLRVGVVGENALPGLHAAFTAANTLTVEQVETVEAAEDAVRKQSLRAILVVPPDAAKKMADGGAAAMEIIIDGSNEKSRTAKGRLDWVVKKLGDAEKDRRLKAHDLDPAALTPLSTNEKNLASKSKESGSFLGIILPYVLLMSASFGGMTSAFDLCAGEKERGTLETLLVSPASRHEIILGKLGTICVVSILSGLCSISGLVFGLLQLKGGGSATVGAATEISYTSILAMLLIIVPLALTTSSLLLVISTFARNQKEAQAYVFPFMIVIILPALFSFVLGPESNIAFSLVPILNTALAIKQILSSVFNLPFLALVVASSAFYAALAMRLVVAMFQRESVLFRT